MFNTLKRSVFTVLLVFTLSLIVLFSVSLSWIASVVEEEIFVQRLLLEAKYLKERFVEDQQPQPRGKHFTLYFKSSDIPQPYRDFVTDKISKSALKEQYQIESRYYHFFIGPNTEAYLIVDVSHISLKESTSGEVLRLLLFLLLLTLIASIGTAIFISKKTIVPLVQLTDSLKTENNRIPTLPANLLNSKNELGYLTNTLDKTFKTLASTLARESEFTRDVSHELRTPIAVIQNTFVIADKGLLTERMQKVIQQQTQIMNSRIEILLALARAESIEKTPVPLLEVVEESILSLHKLIEKQHFSIDIDIPLDVKIEANEHLLKLMIANLIENAIKFSSDNSMRICGSKQELMLFNKTNSPVTQDMMSKSNKLEKSDGIGQGLFLIARIVQTLGWNYRLPSHEQEFMLTITFN